MKEVVNKLLKANKTISTMESCTGGSLASAITNIDLSSDVMHFSAVTYSNEFKVKFGVSQEIIDKYTVYSKEVAREMARSITEFTKSNYGVGTTGRLNCKDIRNDFDDRNDIVNFCIYDRDNDIYFDGEIKVTLNSRQENKNLIVERIASVLDEIIR